MESSTTRKGMAISTLLDPAIVWPAVASAFAKLDPRTLVKNPVIFVLEIVTVLTTVILVRDLLAGTGNIGFEFQIVLWLWFTVLFANFAEAIAEGRGKAQADALQTPAHRDAGQVARRRELQGLQARPGHQPEGRRYRPRRGQRLHPVRRRGDRGCRLRQRGGDHRRVGTGDP